MEDWKRTTSEFERGPISHDRPPPQGFGRSSRFAGLSRPAGAPLPRRRPMRGWGGCFRNNSVPRSSQMRNFRSQSALRRDHYQELTDKIVAALEGGVAPWRRPWDPNACGGSTPVNAVTGHRYRGINLFVLGMSPLAFTSGDPRWCSYRQAAARRMAGAQGREGDAGLFLQTRSGSRTKPLIGAARRAAFRCCGRSRSFMLRKLMAPLRSRPRLLRRRSPSASRIGKDGRRLGEFRPRIHSSGIPALRRPSKSRSLYAPVEFLDGAMAKTRSLTWVREDGRSRAADARG